MYKYYEQFYLEFWQHVNFNKQCHGNNSLFLILLFSYILTTVYDMKYTARTGGFYLLTGSSNECVNF